MRAAVCIPAQIDAAIAEYDDDCKAIYVSKDSVCIWMFDTREERNAFQRETSGMTKQQRNDYFESGRRDSGRRN